MKKSYLLLFAALFACTFSEIAQASNEIDEVYPQFGNVVMDGESYRILTKFNSASGHRPVAIEYPTVLNWNNDDENLYYQTILSGTVNDGENNYFPVECFTSPTRVPYRELNSEERQTPLNDGWYKVEKITNWQGGGNHTFEQVRHLYDRKVEEVDGDSFTRRHCRFAKWELTQGKIKLRHFGTKFIITPVYELITTRFPGVEELSIERGEQIRERCQAIGGETESPECGAQGYIAHPSPENIPQPDIMTLLGNRLSGMNLNF